MPDANPESIKPLTSALDLRSQVDSMVRGSLRWRGNFQTISKTEVRPRPQHRKLLSNSNYNNEDLRDQLLSLRRKFQVRQPITLLFPGTATSGQKFLFAATESTIYQLTVATGNWRILGDSFGTGATDGSGPRFTASMNGDYVTFTNGFDPPQQYAVGSAPDPSTGMSVAPISDLDLIGLSQARVTWEWRGITFFADVTMLGQRASYRIVWSDFENSPSFDPAVIGTLSGEQDLNLWETVLAGAAWNTGFLVYTTHGIWSMTPNPAGGKTFSFSRIYGFDNDDTDRIGCLKYRNSLVTVGADHVYVADDNIYTFNPFYQRPKLADWINQASRKMMDELDDTYCDNLVAAVNGREIYYSYPTVGNGALPSTTLVLNTQYEAADYVDYGYACFAAFYPDHSETIRQFIVRMGICTDAGLSAAGFPYVREGISDIAVPAPAFVPTCIYTNQTLTIGDLTVEDYTKSTPDADSLCALLALEDDPTAICDAQCDTGRIFVGASTRSFTLKEIGAVWYRESCQNAPAVGTTDSLGYHTGRGSYSLDAFDAVIRLAPWFGRQPNQDAHAEKFELEFNPEVAAAGAVHLRIGQAAQIADPNSPTAPIKWNTLSTKPIKSLLANPPPAGSRPASTCQWRFDFIGHYLFFEFTVNGVGCDAIFTRATATADIRDVRSR
jgi:hypothetical protein